MKVITLIVLILSLCMLCGCSYENAENIPASTTEKTDAYFTEKAAIDEENTAAINNIDIIAKKFRTVK